MNRIAKTAVAATGLAAVAVPTTIALAGPAAAAEVTGTCRGAVYELNVDRENGRFEVDADIDGAAAGSQWRIALFQNGERFLRVVRTADREGEIEIEERLRADAAGSDTFKLSVKRVGDASACTVSLVR